MTERVVIKLEHLIHACEIQFFCHAPNGGFWNKRADTDDVTTLHAQAWISFDQFIFEREVRIGFPLEEQLELVSLDP
jgi:hypothetical protein